MVLGKRMEDQLRFAVAYWHTFLGGGRDPFGPETRVFPWDEKAEPMAAAKDRLDAAFEFVSKLGAPFYAFHDRDVAPSGYGQRRGLLLGRRPFDRSRLPPLRVLWHAASRVVWVAEGGAKVTTCGASAPGKGAVGAPPGGVNIRFGNLSVGHVVGLQLNVC